MPPETSCSDLFVRRHGDGDRVWVGLHGWNGTHRTFDPLVEHLPPDISLYAVDLPGYGKSPPPETWSLRAVGRDVERALRDLGVEHCSLIGSCSGAVVGLSVARALGEDLDHFVLLEPFAFIPWYLSMLTAPVVGWWFYWLSFGTNIGRRIAESAMADNRTGETDLMASFARTDLAVPHRYLRLFGSLDRAEDFADLDGTKHLLYAEHTFGAVRRSVERWQSVWPEPESHRVRDAGHLLLEEAPRRVGSYLDRLDPFH